MRGLWRKYRIGVILSAAYIGACIILGNLPSSACDYPAQGQSQQCTHTRSPTPLNASFVRGIGWVEGWETDEYIAFGTLLLALFTYMLVSDAKDTSRRQLRAYVFVESGIMFDSSSVAPFDPARKLFPVANFSIRNSGQTPAFQQVSWGQLEVIRPEHENTLTVPTELQKISPMALGANSAHPVILKLNPDRALTPQEIVDVQTGVKAIFAYGRLEYLDSFGALRWTNYRSFYTGDFPPPTNMIFNFSVSGNDAS